MVYGWGSVWFLRYKVISKIVGAGPDPWVTPQGRNSSTIQSVTSLGIRIYMVKGWGSEWFLRSNIISQIEGVGPDPWGHQSSNIQSVTS